MLPPARSNRPNTTTSKSERAHTDLVRHRFLWEQRVRQVRQGERGQLVPDLQSALNLPRATKSLAQATRTQTKPQQGAELSHPRTCNMASWISLFPTPTLALAVPADSGAGCSCTVKAHKVGAHRAFHTQLPYQIHQAIDFASKHAKEVALGN